MTTLIKNAKIIVGDGSFIENGNILFDKDKILKIGKEEYKADKVIDGTGKTVLPGFIDCHVHAGFIPFPWTDEEVKNQDEITVAMRAVSQAKSFFKSGITTIRSVGSGHDVDVRLRELIKKGEIQAPRIFAAGRPICITSGHCCDIGIEVDTVGEALKAARTLCKKKVDWIKLMPTSGVIGVGPSTNVQLSNEQIKAICDVGRAFDTPTCAHIMNYNALIECVEAGLTCVEHGYDMDDKVANMMVDKGTWYIPTAVVTLYESMYMDESNPMKEKAAQAQIRVRNALKVAISNNVKMAVGTDSGCPYTNPDTYAFAKELYLYTISGMSEMDTLVCATKKGAELLGIDDIVGTLEEGKIADIVVINGDPLQDINNTKNVEYTYRGGELVYKSLN
ncbi:amidohydrolase family protein [Intestinibacter sp.]